jgi:hypothetical protein
VSRNFALPFWSFVGCRRSKADNTGAEAARGKAGHIQADKGHESMIRKLKSGEYRLYSRKKDSKTGKRRNLGTFPSLAKAKEHERAVQFFKRH